MAIPAELQADEARRAEEQIAKKQLFQQELDMDIEDLYIEIVYMDELPLDEVMVKRRAKALRYITDVLDFKFHRQNSGRIQQEPYYNQEEKEQIDDSMENLETNDLLSLITSNEELQKPLVSIEIILPSFELEKEISETLAHFFVVIPDLIQKSGSFDKIPSSFFNCDIE